MPSPRTLAPRSLDEQAPRPPNQPCQRTAFDLRVCSADALQIAPKPASTKTIFPNLRNAARSRRLSPASWKTWPENLMPPRHVPSSSFLRAKPLIWVSLTLPTGCNGSKASWQYSMQVNFLLTDVWLSRVPVCY